MGHTVSLLKFISTKTLLSLTSTGGSRDCSMYIHDLESPFNNSADLYQLRRFLLLGSFELQDFKQAPGSYTNFFTCNYFVPSVWISKPFFLTVSSKLIAKMLL